MTDIHPGPLPDVTALRRCCTALLSMGLLLMVATSAEANHRPPAEATAAQRDFSEEQQAQIGEIAANWLVEHPEYLVAASDRLRQQQQMAQQQVLRTLAVQNAAALLADDAPATGPREAKTAVVMFFDYQCADCRKISSAVARLHKENPAVRFIFREYPVFASRWPVSGYAARVGEAVWSAKGDDAYLGYHHALFEQDQGEGQLTPAMVNTAARAYLTQAQLKQAEVGGNHNLWQQRIDKNMRLGASLQLPKVPALIVLPTANASAENLTVITAGGEEEALRQAMVKVTSTER
ncbi:thioredoxin domain-containing protein [Serratia rubidaea]|uniref:thioredoxin domain-containing protein n=1 Tax=Serratia rubidaea TaxID=61652 RepID=UPI0023AF5348|nr:thioredoxin domain-containing protein [Serratia rubidaea]MDK1705087.1 thioredoxin domain-containing protein [Serratia rubidaea]